MVLWPWEHFVESVVVLANGHIEPVVVLANGHVESVVVVANRHVESGKHPPLTLEIFLSPLSQPF